MLNVKNFSLNVRPQVVCADGTTLSVQASKFHYSTPRTDKGPYTAVEVGFVTDSQGNPIELPESWNEYGDGCGIYGFIPVELVIEFISMHGGFADADAPEIKVIGWSTRAKVV